MKKVLSLTTSCFGGLEKYCRGLFAMFLFLLITIVMANSANAQSSPFAGRYSGDWTSKFVETCSSLFGKLTTEGTLDIFITSDGDVRGTKTYNTTAKEATLKGFIDDDGSTQITIKNEGGSFTLEGTLEKRGTRLLGTLKYHNTGYKNCDLIFKLVLKRVKENSNTSASPLPTQPKATSSLEGTKWSYTFGAGDVLMVADTVLSFEKNGKVISEKSETADIFDLFGSTTKVEGTYRQEGDKIFINLPKVTISGVIRGNSLELTSTFKEDNRTLKWTAKKVTS